MARTSSTKINSTSTQVTPETTSEFPFEHVPGVCKVCGKPALHEIGSTCQKHLGKARSHYQSAPKDVTTDSKFVKIGKLCDLAETLSKTRGYAVKLTGGDNGVRSPAYPEFQVYTLTVGKQVRKFVKVEALAKLQEILKS